MGGNSTNLTDVTKIFFKKLKENVKQFNIVQPEMAKAVLKELANRNFFLRKNNLFGENHIGINEYSMYEKSAIEEPEVFINLDISFEFLKNAIIECLSQPDLRWMPISEIDAYMYEIIFSTCNDIINDTTKSYQVLGVCIPPKHVLQVNSNDFSVSLNKSIKKFIGNLKKELNLE
ncbi:MAG: hypothetical protein N2749_01920 [Clostridia bacterium]|nr:hypothetical protein [Clostridia bacterium]